MAGGGAERGWLQSYASWLQRRKHLVVLAWLCLLGGGIVGVTFVFPSLKLSVRTRVQRLALVVLVAWSWNRRGALRVGLRSDNLSPHRSRLFPTTQTTWPGVR
jgi:hypothetical protein